MALVKAVYFSQAQEIENIRILLSREELEWATGTSVPGVIAEPLGASISYAEAFDWYKRAGKVPGNSPDYKASSEIYYALIPIIEGLGGYGG